VLPEGGGLGCRLSLLAPRGDIRVGIEMQTCMPVCAHTGMVLKRQQGAGLPRETQPQTCCQQQCQHMQASTTHTKTCRQAPPTKTSCAGTLSARGSLSSLAP
jgi:hypothetical protein